MNEVHSMGISNCQMEKQGVKDTFVHVGFGCQVSVEHIDIVMAYKSISRSDARLVQQAKEREQFVDATHGRKAKALVVQTSGRTILSSTKSETIVHRVKEARNNERD